MIQHDLCDTQDVLFEKGHQNKFIFSIMKQKSGPRTLALSFCATREALEGIFVLVPFFRKLNVEDVIVIFSPSFSCLSSKSFIERKRIPTKFKAVSKLFN
jgi:hypothetical protein